MNVLFFLKERTKFIRRFYQAAAEPFRVSIHKIEAKEPPFDDPPYSEDNEPPFMEEWVEAEMALEMLGRSCLSMLSASLLLYFKTWETELGVQWEKGERDKAFKSGFVQGYRYCFGSSVGLSWDDCPVNFDILEDIVFARNSDQHPEQITTMHVPPAKRPPQGARQSFFMKEFEREMCSDSDIASIRWLRPNLDVSSEFLSIAINEVEALGEWLEERMLDAKYPARHRR